jgi:urea carboxylase-associated protein 1
MSKEIELGEMRTWEDQVSVALAETVPARKPWAGTVSKNQILRIIDLKGRQAVDFLCYNAEDTQERYSAPNTMKIAGKTVLTKGHALYSDLARPLFTIIEDTYGRHDTIGGCCSAPSNLLLYGAENSPGCRENFLHALNEFGMGRKDIVPNVNFFMQVHIKRDGRMEIARGNSPPGSFVDLRAEMDVLTVLSNCPQVNNPCNDFTPTPIRVVVWSPKNDKVDI